MVRHRKTVKIVQHNGNIETSSSSGSDVSSGARKSFQILSGWKTAVGVLCFSIAAYVSILGYLETRVNTPFDDEKVSKKLCLLLGDLDRCFSIFLCFSDYDEVRLERGLLWDSILKKKNFNLTQKLGKSLNNSYRSFSWRVKSRRRDRNGIDSRCLHDLQSVGWYQLVTHLRIKEMVAGSIPARLVTFGIL